jgi:hypothetical protein
VLRGERALTAVSLNGGEEIAVTSPPYARLEKEFRYSVPDLHIFGNVGVGAGK